MIEKYLTLEYRFGFEFDYQDEDLLPEDAELFLLEYNYVKSLDDVEIVHVDKKAGFIVIRDGDVKEIKPVNIDYYIYESSFLGFPCEFCNDTCDMWVECQNIESISDELLINY